MKVCQRYFSNILGTLKEPESTLNQMCLDEGHTVEYLFHRIASILLENDLPTTDQLRSVIDFLFLTRLFVAKHKKPCQVDLIDHFLLSIFTQRFEQLSFDHLKELMAIVYRTLYPIEKKLGLLRYADFQLTTYPKWEDIDLTRCGMATHANFSGLRMPSYRAFYKLYGDTVQEALSGIAEYQLSKNFNLLWDGVLRLQTLIDGTFYQSKFTLSVLANVLVASLGDFPFETQQKSLYNLVYCFRSIEHRLGQNVVEISIQY